MRPGLNFISSIFRHSNTEIDSSYTLISYVVEISFNTEFQVGYVCSDGRFIIREYSGKTFDYEFYCSPLFNNIRLQVFLTNPNLLENQNVKLIIKKGNVVMKEKTFAVDLDYQWAGWFQLNTCIGAV